MSDRRVELGEEVIDGHGSAESVDVGELGGAESRSRRQIARPGARRSGHWDWLRLAVHQEDEAVSAALLRWQRTQVLGQVVACVGAQEKTIIYLTFTTT